MVSRTPSLVTGYESSEVRISGYSTFCQVLHDGNGAGGPVLGSDSRPQLGRAVTHRLIADGLLNGLCECLNRQLLAGNRRWPHPQLRHALPPEELIANEGNHNRGNHGAEARGSGPGPAVMDDSRGPGQQSGEGDGVQHED